MPGRNETKAGWRVPEVGEFTYVRLFGDEAGVTHFEELHLPTSPTGLGPLRLGLVGHCQELRILQGTSDLDASIFHSAPERQYLVVLSGTMRVRATDGTVRALSPGSVLLLDDIGSAGHATEIVTAEMLALVVAI